MGLPTKDMCKTLEGLLEGNIIPLLTFLKQVVH